MIQSYIPSWKVLCLFGDKNHPEDNYSKIEAIIVFLSIH